MVNYYYYSLAKYRQRPGTTVTVPLISFTLHVNFFVINNFYFIFSHTTQHNIQNKNKTKQNSRHILNISRFNQKGGREGRTTRTQKSLLYIITYIQQKTLPSLNGWRPGPTDSCRCTFTWDNLQEATDPICLSTHVRCKPALNYCLLHSCKTSKQHSLLHWANTETRIIIKKTRCTSIYVVRDFLRK